MNGLRLEMVGSPEALDRIEDGWWELWRASPTATPFTSPAWLIPWWRAFQPGTVRSLALRRGERLVGLAPLYVERGEHGGRLLPLGLGLSDLFDILLDPTEPDGPAALAAGFADALDGLDRCELEELPPDALAARLPLPGGCREATGPQSARPVLVLHGPDGPPVPSGQRRKLRMTRHRIARRGGTLESVPGDGVETFLADLVRLHGARWAGRGEAGVLADERVRRFHAAALPRLARSGLARLSRLVVDGQVAGAYYGLAHRGRAYAYLGGFDPAFAFESPGTALIGDAIERAAGEGATRFDFLRGRESYKYAWGAADEVNLRRSLVRIASS